MVIRFGTCSTLSQIKAKKQCNAAFRTRMCTTYRTVKSKVKGAQLNKNTKKCVLLQYSPISIDRKLSNNLQLHDKAERLMSVQHSIEMISNNLEEILSLPPSKRKGITELADPVKKLKPDKTNGEVLKV